MTEFIKPKKQFLILCGQKYNMFIVDFDDTLFNTHRFKKARCAGLEAVGVPEDLFWQTYKTARSDKSGVFTYSDEKHAEVLEAYGFDKESIMTAFAIVNKRMSELLFPETIGLLKIVREFGHKIILLSLGNEKFQRLKIDNTGIEKYVDEIFIVEDCKLNVVKDIIENEVSKIWFLNDKIVEMREIWVAYPQINPIIKLSHSIRDVDRSKVGMPCFTNLVDVEAYVKHYLQ